MTRYNDLMTRYDLAALFTPNTRPVLGRMSGLKSPNRMGLELIQGLRTQLKILPGNPCPAWHFERSGVHVHIYNSLYWGIAHYPYDKLWLEGGMFLY